MKNIYKLCFVFSLFGCSQGVFSQQALYTKTIGGINSDFLLTGANNSIFIFGGLRYADDQLVITKVDSAGSVMWNKYYSVGTSTIWSIPQFYDAVGNPDSSITIVGQSSNNGSGFAFIMKIKPNGDTLWTKKLSDPAFNSFVPYKITLSKDSGFVITGEALSSSWEPSRRVFVSKFTKNGTLTWLKTYTNSFYRTIGFGIQQTPDSGYVVVGSKLLSGSSLWRTFIHKIDKNGEPLWSNFLDSSNFQASYGLDVVVDNLGFTILSVVTKPCLKRFDHVGNLIWTKCYDEYVYTGLGFISDMRLRRTSNKGYLIISKGLMYGSGLVITTDSMGIPVWRSNVNYLPGCDAVQNKDKTFSIVVNQQYYMVKSKLSQGMNPDFQIYRTDSLGMNTLLCGAIVSGAGTITPITLSNTPISFTATNAGIISALQPTISTYTVVTVTGCLTMGGGLNDRSNSISGFVIYPNPAQNKFELRSELNSEKVLSVAIIDLSGREVIHKDWMTGEGNLEVEGAELESGTYIYLIYENKMIIHSGKFVVN